MAKSVFRRFPSDDLESDLPEWGAVNIDGQAFVRTGVGARAWDIMEDFWEFVAGGYSGVLKRWTGASWIKEPLKRWTGAAWVPAVLKRWTGTEWVQVDTTGV